MRKAANKRRLTEIGVRQLKPKAAAYQVWDALQRGLAVRVQPTGQKAWKVIYARQGRTRWLHLGDVGAIGLADARMLAGEAMLEVARGKDPAAEKTAQRGAGSFTELAARYLEEHAKRHNKSWRQADALVCKHLIPVWGKLKAADLNRGDVKAMMRRIEAPIVANKTLAAASAIFTWAVKEEILTVNPCRGVDRNPTHSRERVLSDTEVALFWAAFDAAGREGAALKTILLCGQRPGEVAHMRREHLVDGWWQLPGAPESRTQWLGTKNGASHRIWLAAPVRELIGKSEACFGFVFGHRSVTSLDEVMRKICKKLAVNEKVTPHDLRRTFSTKVTKLKFGRDAMNRVINHREGGISDVYDIHDYAEENRQIMETVASQIVGLVEGRPADNVLTFGKR